MRSLETISAGLAHEIHNPLSYIRNALVVIAEQVTKINTRLEGAHGDAEIAKAQKRIENMSAVAERGIGRIEQLVQLVRRYAREGYPQEPDVLALDAMVSDVLALVGPRRESAVTLERDLQAGGAAVRCIPEELHQVVRNLVQNAIDACGSEGTVRVETRARPREVLLRVLDDGPGIPADLQARIFTPFFSTKGRGDGMGLGLAITHQIIAAAKGRLELKSVEGEGTTFEVYLPRAAAEPAAASG